MTSATAQSHVRVGSDRASEAPEGERDDDSRDDDTPPSTETAAERGRQERIAQSQLLPGYSSPPSAQSQEEMLEVYCPLSSIKLQDWAGSGRNPVALPSLGSPRG